MNSRFRQLLAVTAAAQITACVSNATVQGNPQHELTSLPGYLGQWNGAAAAELIAALGEPSETLNALPEQGLAPTLSWFSSSEDYLALELLEIESYKGSEHEMPELASLTQHAASHECQIHATLSADGMTVIQLTKQSIGDCDHWLPLPVRDSMNATMNATMTVAIDE